VGAVVNSALIATLVRDQAPDHADCRAQDFVSLDGGKIVVQCSCNVRLTLAVPKVAAPEPIKASKAPKVADDGS